jgi:hypothetical protein
LLIDNCQKEEEPQEDEPYYDEENEEAVVKGDDCLCLVMRKVLINCDTRMIMICSDTMCSRPLALFLGMFVS